MQHDFEQEKMQLLPHSSEKIPKKLMSLETLFFYDEEYTTLETQGKKIA